MLVILIYLLCAFVVFGVIEVCLDEDKTDCQKNFRRQIRENIPIALLSIGYTALLTVFIGDTFGLSRYPYKDVWDSVLVVGIYSVIHLLHKRIPVSFASKLLETIKDESRNSIMYRSAFDVLMGYQKRCKETSFLVDEFVRDYSEHLKYDTFLISRGGYIRILRKLVQDNFQLIGVNNLLPPYWYSPRYVNEDLESYKRDSQNKSNQIVRINYYPDRSWMENTVSKILEDLRKSPDFGEVKTYCWFAYLINQLRKEGIDISNNVDLLDESDANISTIYLKGQGQKFNAINTRENNKAISEFLDRLIMQEQDFLKQLNDKIDESFEKLNIKLIAMEEEEVKSKIKINSSDWVELIVASRGDGIEFGLLVLYKMSHSLQVQIINGEQCVGLRKSLEELQKGYKRTRTA